jgi:hypothetical protein
LPAGPESRIRRIGKAEESEEFHEEAPEHPTKLGRKLLLMCDRPFIQS